MGKNKEKTEDRRPETEVKWLKTGDRSELIEDQLIGDWTEGLNTHKW
jgi:hypothetical protein